MMELQINDRYFQEKSKAVDLLHEVLDPELMVNIMDLGLVYNLEFIEPEKIVVTMTLTSQGCPLGDAITQGVKNALAKGFPSHETEVVIVWEPHWTFEEISPAGREQLGF